MYYGLCRCLRVGWPPGFLLGIFGITRCAASGIRVYFASDGIRVSEYKQLSVSGVLRLISGLFMYLLSGVTKAELD